MSRGILGNIANEAMGTHLVMAAKEMPYTKAKVAGRYGAEYSAYFAASNSLFVITADVLYT